MRARPPTTLAIAIALAAMAWAPLAHARGEPGPEKVLARAQALLDGPQAKLAGGAPTRELTTVLVRLADVYPRLGPSQRAEARAILARPDDGASDRYRDGYEVPEAPASPHCDTEFCVHWVAEGPHRPNLDDANGSDDGDGVPDFVEDVLASAAHSRAVQNTTLGWTYPKSDGPRGGGGPGRTDIYLLETNGRYFGYASPDEGQGRIDSKHAYLVLDNDYSEFGGDGSTETELMQVTMAHEYNHVLQFAYDSRQRDDWMYEATATWIEEHAHPAIDDYLRYVPAFARAPHVSLTGGARTNRIYGAAVFNHHLDQTSGPEVIRDAWAASAAVTSKHFSVAAYDTALGGAGRKFRELADAYAAFASATAEWSVPAAPFPDPALLPDVRRDGKLRPGRPAHVSLDHLAHSLWRVGKRRAAKGVSLVVRGPAKVGFAIDLVGRTGSATAGSVTSSVKLITDGRGRVKLPAAAYDRITAVVANVDARLNRHGRYRTDDTRLRVKLIRAG